MMQVSSIWRFAPFIATLLVTGCGSVTDDRHSSESAGSGGSTSASVGVGGAGAVATSSSSMGGGGAAPCPSTIWAHAFSSPMGQAFGDGVAVDAACNVYITGTYEAQIDLGAGALVSPSQGSLYLAKLDPDGNTLWSRTFGKDGWSDDMHLALDSSGNVLLTGWVNGSLDLGDECGLGWFGGAAFLAKLDGDGKSIFCHVFGGVQPLVSWGNSVASSAVGDMVVVGGFDGGDYDFGSGTIPHKGAQQGFVLAFDSQGKFRWVVPITSDADVMVRQVLVSPEGVVHVGGDFNGKMSFGLESAGNRDIFVVEISADGEPTWARRFGAPGFDILTAMTADVQGGLIFAGASVGGIDLGAGPLTGAGDFDALVARLDAKGNAVFGRLYGDAGEQIIADLTADDLGNVLLVGTYTGTIDFGGGSLLPMNPVNRSVFLAKLDPEGKQIWSRGIAIQKTPVNPIGYSIALDRSRNALIAGTFGGTIDLGTGPLYSSKDNAIFVAKIAP
jgi:hypothetical protein